MESIMISYCSQHLGVSPDCLIKVGGYFRGFTKHQFIFTYPYLETNPRPTLLIKNSEMKIFTPFSHTHTHSLNLKEN